MSFLIVQNQGDFMGLPAVTLTESLPALFEADLALAVDYARAEKSPATRRAYATDFALFRAWCESCRHLEALPASSATVCAFLAFEAKRSKTATIGRRVAAIRYAHKLGNLPVPTDDERVKATMRGIRRTIGAAAVKKAPATGDLLMAMASTTGEGLKGQRDRALLLLGFAGAFRRSELVALDVADLVETEDGYRITIRRGKTDQEAQGATIGIIRGARACPVKAVKRWLETAGITEGAIFRSVAKGGKVSAARLSAEAVAVIVKDAAERAGLDPAIFAGHSLRSGFLTSAAKRGASVFKMMDVSRHRSVDTLRGYIRDGELFQEHAGAGLL
jgi:site-specific recombinase XerD